MMSSPAQASSPRPLPRRVDDDGARRADLAAIHICKQQLQLTDDSYRDLMWTVCQARSAGALDRTGRKRFLDHLRQCIKASGLEPRSGKAHPGATAKARHHARPLSPKQGKAWSLWMQLADAGIVRERSSSALNSFVKRIAQVDALQFCNGAQLDLVIETLKKWLARTELPGGLDNQVRGDQTAQGQRRRATPGVTPGTGADRPTQPAMGDLEGAR
jgi:hypothetical protein